MTEAGAKAHSPSAALLDPRVKRTRESLRQALLSHLGEQSFETVSVHEIAERAGVNRVTFYDHYTDKFALLGDIIGESFREHLRVRSAAKPDGGCSLRPLVLAACDYLGMLNQCCGPDHEPLFEPLLGSKVKALLRDLLQPGLEALQARDGKRLRLPPELGAVMAGGAIYGAVHAWAMGGAKPSFSAEQVADRILPTIEASLFAAPGEESAVL